MPTVGSSRLCPASRSLVVKPSSSVRTDNGTGSMSRGAERWYDMLALVTGGAGHVGTSLVDVLVADGHEVRVVAVRGPARGSPSNVRWINADVRDAIAMRSAMDGVDVIYHLAAVISIVGELAGSGPIPAAVARTLAALTPAKSVPMRRSS